MSTVQLAEDALRRLECAQWAEQIRIDLMLTAFIGCSAEPQVTAGAAPLKAACTQLNNEALVESRKAGPWRQRRRYQQCLPIAILDRVCVGLIMNNLSALLLASGRLAEAEVW